jgi:hypothetical protein
MTEPLALRVAHLYPKLMNIYGDRGNVMCLERRCRLRGISFSLTALELGDGLDPAAYDMIFIGGAQDREQKRVADDLLATKAQALRQAAEEGVVVLAVCGGYQLLGQFYRSADGSELRGAGVLDLWTIHPGPRAKRLIGNIVIEWGGQTVVGFENHGGRTYLGPHCRPLGRVLAGHGNNGEDGGEGATYRNVIGTYLHGALLPKNPALADHLILAALRRRYPGVTLSPLDDRIEEEAHRQAVRLARRRSIISIGG